jgi:hypothetical protein
LDAFTVALLVAVVCFLLWALTGSFVAATIRDSWPDLYAKAGSPNPRDFWLRRSGPGQFDGFTLLRRFRNIPVQNRDVLVQLELVCWLRWLQIAALVGCFLALAASFLPRVAP